MLKDVKEGTTTGRKPDTTHVRSSFLVYSSRPGEYGCDKYVDRANYLRPTGEAAHTTPTKADVARLRNYVRASMDHARKMLDAIEHHEALDPEFKDIDGLRRATYAADTDTTPGNAIGPSLLPHIAPACTSLMMAIEQAIGCGLLPEDPGQPWKRGADRAVSWSVDYIDGSSAMVWRAAPDMPSEPPPADAAPAQRRFPGCRSNECAIRNRCTGAACCPRPHDPVTGRVVETLHTTALSTMLDKATGAALDDIAALTGVSRDPDAAYRDVLATQPATTEVHAALDKLALERPHPDAARFMAIEANIKRTKADADKLAEEKMERDARPAPQWRNTVANEESTR
jgi:hypothetical protein